MEGRVKLFKKEYWLYLYPENSKEKKILKKLFENDIIWISPQLVTTTQGEPVNLVYQGRKK